MSKESEFEELKFDLQLFAGDDAGGPDPDEEDLEEEEEVVHEDVELAAGEGEGDEWGKFLAQGPDEFKRHPAFKGMKTIGDLQKAYLELQEEAEAEVPEGNVKLLSEFPTDEELAEYREKMGIPETPDGYELTPPVLAEVLGLDKSAMEKFAEKVHSLNLTKNQVNSIYDWYNAGLFEAYSERVKEYKGELEASVKELKDEWGNDYDENIEYMKRGFRAFKMALGKERGKRFEMMLFDEKPEGTRLGTHPLMVRAFNYLGRKITGKMPLEGEPAGAPEPDILDKIYPEMKKYKKKRE